MITRLFDAPREVVWAAWSDPDQVKQWAGPAGFSIPSWKADRRVGGEWQMRMHSAEWGEVSQHGVYHDITRPERLVFTTAWDKPHEGEASEHVMLVTITFTDLGEKTGMRFRQAVFANEQSRDSHIEGWSECFDKLVGHLAARS